MAEPLTAMELDALRIAAVDRNFVGYGPRSAEVAVLRLVATLDQLATPIRFDPDDRSTWPEDGQRVLLDGPDRVELAEFYHGVPFLADPNRPTWWLERTSDWVAAQTGDPWWPLPPTQGGAE